MIDAETRRLGQEIGLDTLVLPTVNDEWQVLIVFDDIVHIFVTSVFHVVEDEFQDEIKPDLPRCGR